MKTKITALFIFIFTICSISIYPFMLQARAKSIPAPIAQPSVPVSSNKKIEVVFVLDTTGSMGSLIQAAKDNIWSIASTMAAADPTPELHMGLVAFRDRGDAYVTKISDLTTDLDQMYSTLMDYRAGGGGDGPESVNKALYDAVHNISWSEQQENYKVIFLIGDAPPHMDYQEVQYPEIIAAAKQKGIVVNAIQAGQEHVTRKTWQRIASLNQGRYFQVGQTGDAVAVATPFDEKIANLAKKLDETRLFYGDKRAREKAKAKTAAAKKMAESSSKSVLAKRGAFNSSDAGKRNFVGEQELVDDLASGKIELEALRAAELPQPLVSLSPKQRQEEVAKRANERNELQRNIRDLAEQRQDYIKKELAESNKEEGSLDKKLFDAIRIQARSKGLNYSEEAVAY